MPYERTEVSAQEIERQKEICARVRSALGSGERFAMVDTYGCQQNESDSEVLRGYLRSMGYTMTDDEDKADVIAVNTCAVREHATMRVFAHAFKARPPGTHRDPLRLHGAERGDPRAGEKVVPHGRSLLRPARALALPGAF